MFLEFNDKEANYIQLYKKIKNDIITNNLKPNEKLPSKRLLAQELKISINTVISSYNLLLDEGFIISIPKKGYFITPYLVNKKINNYESNIIPKKEYSYDFTTSDIDKEAFPYYTWSKIAKDILSNNQDSFLRTDYKGSLELRETIAKYIYESKGIKIDINSIIIGSGVEYLFTNLLSLLNGDDYGIENPSYKKIEKIILNNHKNINYLPIDNEGVIVPKTPLTALYVTPSNQFPTGIKMSLKRKLELIKYANNTNTYLIEDEFDSEFKYLSLASTSLINLDNNKTIFLSTYSRTISPALRIAYMILPKDLLKIYESKYYSYSSSVSTLDQLILNSFIKKGYYSRHLNKTKILYKQKHDLIINSLESSLVDVSINNSLLSVNVIIKKKTNMKDLLDKLEKASIKVRCLDDFYFNDITTNILIIGYSSIPISKIKEGIDIINKTIKG